MKEPVLLPASFPSILVNSNQGIAVGMASNICSFNLREVCEATIAYIRDKETDFLDTMPAPDFSGGGQILYDRDQMREIYETGKGSIILRSKYNIDTKNNLIEITEIPYSTSSEAIIDGIADLVKAGKIKEINDVRDETDLDGLKITIDCKRGTNHEELMKKLFRFTKLQDTFSCNFNILINGSPRVCGVRDILDEWVKWRRECVSRELAFDLGKKKSKLHLLEGLEKILLDIDKAIAIIRNTELEEDVVPNLMKGFDIDKIQADYVAEIKLRNINKQYILNRIADKEKLTADIADIEDILGKTNRINTLICKKLKEVADKYGQDRRTELVTKETVETYVPARVIEDYPVHLMLTRHGYLKKLTANALKRSDDMKIKDGDEIFMDVEAMNKSDIIFFSDKFNVYKAKTYEFSDNKVTEFGSFLANELGMEEDEKIIHMLVTTDYSGKLMIGFKNGKAAYFPVKAYETKQNRKKLVNAYSDKSPAVSFVFIPDDEDPDLIARSDLGKAAVFKASMVSFKTTRTTQGVQLLISKKGSNLLEIAYLNEVGIKDPEYYRIRNIPAIGYYIKADSFENKQMGIEDLT